MLKKIVWVVGGVALLLIVVLGVLAYTTFGTSKPLEDDLTHGRVTQVVDGYVAAYIVDLGDAGVALVDTGSSKDAEAILQALEAMGREPFDVSAILLTHGHPDHIAGIAVFPQADVYAEKDEIPLLEGTAEISHPLEDGQTFSLGEVEVTVFHVPGHTAGSVAYLIDGVLILGDSAHVSKSGELMPSPWIFTKDPAQNRASLKALAERIPTDAIEVMVFSHSGSLDGAQALIDYGT